MATFTNQTKNIATWSNIGLYAVFLATESGYTLTCENGDELLLGRNGITSWTNQIKN